MAGGARNRRIIAVTDGSSKSRVTTEKSVSGDLGLWYKAFEARGAYEPNPCETNVLQPEDSGSPPRPKIGRNLKEVQ